MQNNPTEQSCYNCKHAYPNYRDYNQGPCLIFEEKFGDSCWYDLSLEHGCEYWEQKQDQKRDKG